MTGSGDTVSLPARLVGASHPLPTVAVTGFTVALALTLDLSAATVAVIGLATLAGQLSIGWSNDLIDADRDARAGRTDKPMADGRGRRELIVATAIALSVWAGLSLSVGLRAAACHLAVVAGGWAYNLGMKATVWSWLPYAVAFGLLPSWVVAAQPGSPWAPLWMGVAAGCLGVAAHFVNAAPDVADDLETGVAGLPQRWGAARSVIVALGLLMLGSVVGLTGPAGSPATWQWLVLAGVLAVGIAAAVAVRAAEQAGRALPRATFAVMLALVAVVIALILSAGTT